MTADPVRQRRDREAADAWSRGRIALDAGDFPRARFWLERACRIAPDDPRPRFDLALVLAALGDSKAGDELEAIAAGYDCSAAWIALARVSQRDGDRARAARALDAMLGRYEIPPDATFGRLAGEIARSNGMQGWCGIAAGERLRIEAPRSVVHEEASRLDVTSDGSRLLGSPIDLASLRRIDGIVEADGAGMSGWAINWAAPSRSPVLVLVDSAGRWRNIRPRRMLEPAVQAPFLPRHGFRIGARTLRGLTPPFRVQTAHGTPLYGSPIDPQLVAGLEPVATRPVRRSLPPRARLCVVMPVYRDIGTTEAALNSLHASLDEPVPVIVVDDASPEPGLKRFLDEERRLGRIILVRHRVNRGFPCAANAGMRAARRRFGACDILLLNADILLPAGAPARLHAALYAGPDIASATPLSNEATILSYPSRGGGNPAPDPAEVATIDRLAWRANRDAAIDIPTAIGFCMAIRHDSLAATGLFREDIFAQGYGEENDWCRRAAGLGFRHVGVPGVFVAHRGGASFGPAGAALCARNLALLERLHPGYHALIEAHHQSDPLRDSRRRLDHARFRIGRVRNGAVALVSHDHGGGIARVVEARMAELRAEGLRPILVQPDFSTTEERESGIGAARVTDGHSNEFPNLTYRLPREIDRLVALLKAERVKHVEFHHTLGHHPLIRSLPERLAVPAEHVIHDYSVFCKRVNLIGPRRRYCGEPDVDGCVACIEEAGSELTDPIAPADLVARSGAELHAARRVVAPSQDAARRLRRHFPGIAVAVTGWEDDLVSVALKPPPVGVGHRLIAVVGGIGPAKGYDVLLDCARDAAARDLALSFVVIGASEDDAPLIETDRIIITGPYQEGEAGDLIRRSGAHLAFLPSIWPETWCFALSEAWRGGLYAVTFDLGAQAERIRATGRGLVLPLGMPVQRINDALLAWRPDLGDLNNRSPMPNLRAIAQY
ncbi:glycosyltransferase [Acidiphilium sp. AL]|uniref:glycosyltransferase n=1 Tax=Acidiphilium sp. AL TaxID=2871704 RepID=UPI0021CB4BA9|nr:glycosyltransferase [Acidiphilium sp. AL]MCU4159146.1 glycosyltransferase [Acidiphilium sp. AL]